jgi:hypothetical protein
MFEIISTICLLSMFGCSSATYENMSVQEITKRTQKNKKSRVVTQFVIRGTGSGDNGTWYLNSRANYKSSLA